MSQEFTLNINNRTSVEKNNPQQQDVNSRSFDESKAQKAFSSELDRQIDKHEPSRKNHKSQEQTASIQKEEQKAEKKSTESGNHLPDGNQDGEPNETSLIPAELKKSEQLTLNINDSAVNEKHDISTNIDAKIIEENVLKNIDAKVTEENVLKNQISKTDAKVAQNGFASEEKTKTPVTSAVSETSPKPVTSVAPKLETTENKQQAQSESKIRPDILQALAAKPVTANKNGDKFTLDITNKVIVGQESVLDKQLNTPEFIKQVKSPITPAQFSGRATDKTTSSFGSTLAPLVNGQATSHTNRVAKTDAPTLDLQPNLQSKAWSRVLSSRVIWMAREGIQQASLKLNPASLGPVEVKISMSNDAANVIFVAQHAATRDALEQALPRLRESFAENGLELTDADISQQSPEEANEQENDDLKGNPASDNIANSDADSDEEQTVTVEQDLESGISIYA